MIKKKEKPASYLKELIVLSISVVLFLFILMGFLER